MAGSNEHKLDELFMAYRESLPDREPTVNFTPELWRRIDQGRKATFSLTRFARGIVTGALALCFMMTALTWSPSSRSTSASPIYTATYLDVLDEDPQFQIETVAETL